MLDLHDVTKKYVGERDVLAVKNVSFKMEQGRFLAIVGRSGSGKSTLLGMIGGISRPTSGRVIVDGCDQWLLKDDGHADFRNRKIGFVFQFASLLPTLRAIDNVALPAIAGGALGQKEAYARAHAMLDRVGLSERVDFYPGQLSGGEQRRVAIARALVNSPLLLLADEPTADLDEETEEDILNLLVNIQKALGLMLVVVTHNMDIAARADHVIEMRAGQASLAQVLPAAVHAASTLPSRGLMDNASRSNPLSFVAADRNYADRSYAAAAVATPYADFPSNGGSISKRGVLIESATEINGLSLPHLAPCEPISPELALETTLGNSLPHASHDRAKVHSQAGVESLYDLPPEAVREERVRLGEGIERFIGRLVLLVVPVLFLLYAVNSGIASYQDKVIEDKAKEQAALEELAMGGLRADVKDVRFGPGKSYVLSLYLRNTTENNRPIYLMAPAVRAFVQVGTSWQEISLKPQDQSMPQVLNITGSRVFNYVFEPDVSDFAQLLPYYMHIRFTNEMLVSNTNEPKHELIERSDNYYVYLKPHNVSDQAILAKMKFPGDPPIWIPMPPH
jgi:ABC-type lipoprotein export system ATPase subunit